MEIPKNYWIKIQNFDSLILLKGLTKTSILGMPVVALPGDTGNKDTPATIELMWCVCSAGIECTNSISEGVTDTGRLRCDWDHGQLNTSKRLYDKHKIQRHL